LRRDSRGGRADVGEFPLQIYASQSSRVHEGSLPLTLLQSLEALKGNLEFVLVGELGGVVENLDAQERDDRHLGGAEARALLHVSDASRMLFFVVAVRGWVRKDVDRRRCALCTA